MVSQVRAETTAELVAVKQQLQGLGTEFDARLDHSNTQVTINELADQMQEHRSEVSVQLARLRERLEKFTQANTQEVGRQVEQLNATFVEIESKLNETTNRQALAPEANSPSDQLETKGRQLKGLSRAVDWSVGQLAVPTSQTPAAL
jgi:DNA-binding transcriptional regulator GbsR (MarR family)